MQITNDIKLKGRVEITLTGPDGKVKQHEVRDNLVVTVGKTYLAAWLAAASQADYFMSWIGIGEGTTSPLVSDTDLEDPLPTRLQASLGSSSNQRTATVTFGAGVDTGAVTEAGLFSEEVAGTLFSRVVFGVYNKEAGDSLSFIWTISFS